MASLVNSSKHLKLINTNPSQTFSKVEQEEGILLILFFEVSITLISKPGEEI